MDIKAKRKELLKMDDRSLVDRILAFPDRQHLNRDEDGKRRQYPSAEMAIRAKRFMEQDPDYRISEKQRFAMCQSFAELSTDELKVAGIKFAAVDPRTLDIGEPVAKEGQKSVYGLTYTLRPEPENEHDRNAVAVYVADRQGGKAKIGYLPGAYVANHPITHEMTAKGTLADYSSGHFKTIGYTIDMDTEALDKVNQTAANRNAYTYQMPFRLNGDVKEGAADYLNTMRWGRDGWAERLNNELEYWGVNGRVGSLQFEFPGSRAGNVIVESSVKLNQEAMQVCGSFLSYSLETGIDSDLKNEGLVDVKQTMRAVNTREKMYFSLRAEPEPAQEVNQESGMTSDEEEAFMHMVDSLSGDGVAGLGM